MHQHAQRTMRYFKWGVARLILEPDVCPDIVPMWIEGNEQVYHEARRSPRFFPRMGKEIRVWFGENVGGEGGKVFSELRRKWRDLVEKERMQGIGKESDDGPSNGREELGLLSHELKYGKEAVELRMECAREIRNEVLRLRRQRGLPDEDPKAGLVETWRQEGGKREGRMEDDSWVKEA